MPKFLFLDFHFIRLGSDRLQKAHLNFIHGFLQIYFEEKLDFDSPIFEESHQVSLHSLTYAMKDLTLP